MPKRSAGILLYRGSGKSLRVLLAHPGGPFWAKKDLGAWSIPKGEINPGESPLAAAKREFEEELGVTPVGDCVDLGELVQPSRKVVHAFALKGEFDPGALKSILFEMDWPPRSGRRASFPEVDRAEWFTPEDARGKILRGQREFIDRLLQHLAASPQAQRSRGTGKRMPLGRK